MAVSKTSKYILSMLLGYLGSEVVERSCKRYLTRKYNFTEKDFEDIKNKVRSVKEILAEKGVESKLSNSSLTIKGGDNELVFKQKLKSNPEGIHFSLIDHIVTVVVQTPRVATKVIGGATALVAASTKLNPDILANFIAGGTVNSLLESPG